MPETACDKVGRGLTPVILFRLRRLRISCKAPLCAAASPSTSLKVFCLTHPPNEAEKTRENWVRAPDDTT